MSYLLSKFHYIHKTKTLLPNYTPEPACENHLQKSTPIKSNYQIHDSQIAKTLTNALDQIYLFFHSLVFVMLYK